MWRKLFCLIHLHQYEDKIHLKKLTNNGIPFEAREVCKGCGKIRNEVTGHILNPDDINLKEMIQEFRREL